MINLNNCKEGDRLKNRAGYDCTYSYKADNKHIVRLLNLTSYYVDDHGFVAKGSPQYMDDITEIVPSPEMGLYLGQCKEGDKLKTRDGEYVEFSHRHRLSLNNFYIKSNIVGCYCVGHDGKFNPHFKTGMDIIQICKHDNIQGDLFKNIPEGVTELVHNGKRYIKRTITKTQWEEVL